MDGAEAVLRIVGKVSVKTITLVIQSNDYNQVATHPLERAQTSSLPASFLHPAVPLHRLFRSRHVHPPLLAHQQH
jgi:hypothetical protein